MVARLPHVYQATGTPGQLQPGDTLALPLSVATPLTTTQASIALPDGAILKAGNVAVPSSGVISVAYGTAFPTGAVSVVLTVFTTSATATLQFQAVLTASSKTGFSAVLSQITATAVAAAAGTLQWQAVGY